MLRSMTSGVTGMKAMQTGMDVIGNNIANVNTNGFKSGRVNFADAISQYYSNNAVNSQNQVGLGAQVGSISNDFTEGPLQNTGRTLDLAIQGNGFFILDTGSATGFGAAGATGYEYTRNGTFFLSPTTPGTAGTDYYLVDANGNKVCDSSGAAITISTSASTASVDSISIDSQGKISGTDTAGTPLTFSSNPIGLASFANQDALQKVGSTDFKENADSGYAQGIDLTTANISTTINSGYLENSNVDLTNELTNMITTQRSYDANSKTITASNQMLQTLIGMIQ